MPILEVQALGAREIYVATALSVLAFLLCVRRAGVKRTQSPDPSTRQSTKSKAMSKDEGGSEQPAQCSAIDTPQNETRGRHAESRKAQLHQGPSSVSAVKPKPPMCFRISNVPRMWSEDELLQVFQSFDDSLDLATGQYRLSLYPACCGPSQTALLNLQCPGNSWDLKPNKDQLIGRGDLDLVMDRHFYGLTPLNTPEGEIVADVVAVTGLAGHAFGSWRNRESNRMWLQDFLPNNIKGIRIMTYGYNTELVGANTQASRLLDHRRDLIQQVQSARSSPEEQNRPIIFLGHSLGGILILQALIQAKTQALHNHILDATRAIFFFGAPHDGLRTTELEAMVQDMSSDSESQPMRLLLQLREGSEFLENQRDELVDIWSGRKIISYYETVGTPTVKKSQTNEYKRNGELAEMVKKVSAQLYLPNEHRIPVPCNHTEMVKFLAPSDGTYCSVASHLKTEVDHIRNERRGRRGVC